MKTKLLPAPHLKVYVNGRLLGWTFGINYKKRTPTRRVYGIDSTSASELVFTTYDISGAMQVFRGKMQGGAEGLGMMAFADKLLQQKYCSIEILDRETDTVVEKFNNCIVQEQSWSVSQKGVLTGSFSFEGIDASNEADQ